MKNKTRRPNLYIIAGPNGAGKTTFARKFLPDYAKCLEFVNVDLIASGLSPFDPERAALKAGRIMLEQIHSLGNRGFDFGFETTLSGKSYLRLLNELKQRKGYNIHLFFLWISSVKLALERIELRVQQGGHNIPEAVVRRRFDKGISNFFRFFQPVVDRWIIFNNSGDVPEVIAFEESGKLEIVDPALFGLFSKYKEP
ncbi:MAG: Zeta toxin family protein [Thermodesulfobacteriota bacterium]|nr:Zeta toxin family protein [Thermodesulfobacteriota bacterium]